MADEARLRAKAEKVARSRGVDPEKAPRAVGKVYSTHGKECSCFACGNPRKYFKEKSISEKKAEIDKSVGDDL